MRQAREHGRFRRELLDDDRWFPEVAVEDDFLDAHPVLLQELMESVNESGSGDSSLRDRDVIEALVALVRSFRTRASSGLHYEATLPSPVQQALLQEFRRVIADYEQAGREMGEARLLDSDALKALVFVLRMALDRSSGRPLARGFLDFLRTELGEDEDHIESRIVLP